MTYAVAGSQPPVKYKSPRGGRAPAIQKAVLLLHKPQGSLQRKTERRRSGQNFRVCSEKSPRLLPALWTRNAGAKLPSSVTSPSPGAPSGGRPGIGRRRRWLGARVSDLIRPDKPGPFGSPVTTATPITTRRVVGGRGPSGPVFLASIFNGQCT